MIKMLKSVKIQGGIFRLEYVAGAAAEGMMQEEHALQKKLGISDKDIDEIASLFDVQHSGVPKIIARFTKESKELLNQVVTLEKTTERKDITQKVKIPTKVTNVKDAKALFTAWKELKKGVEGLKKVQGSMLSQSYKDNNAYTVDLDVKEMRGIVEAAKGSKGILLINKQGNWVTNNTKFYELLKKAGAKGGGKDLKQGKVDVKKVNKVISECNKK